jgi:NAD(P)-dependent dehydrogenase (short-subunit alcohol dehydrogenase family)
MGILEGKVAIITGAGAGLGLSIGRAFAKEGAIVATIGRRADKIAAAAAEFKSIAGKAFGMQGDVGKRDDVNKFVAAVVKEFGAVDILVNNAMAYNMKSFMDSTDEDFEKIFRSGIYGSVYCLQACFPYLKRKGGKVINFASMAGLQGLHNHASYAIAKEGLVGLTRVLALEWAQYNIHVNAIAPLAESDAFNNPDGPEMRKGLIAATPLGRVGDPEKDIGRACVFLAGPDSNWITSRTIYVDGGCGTVR